MPASPKNWHTSMGVIVPAFLKELIYRVLRLQVLFLELDRFGILLGEREEGQGASYTVMSDSEDSTVTYTEGVLQAPPSPDYVPGPEEPEHAPPLPGFIPELVYPEFMPLEDAVLPSEEQPLPTALSPTADSPGYVPESDLEEDPENYPADGGDNGDDEDESSDDDEDDDVDIEGG
ncbi:hypothetical protein Tco_0108975 [Tanacetum coccineum]